MADSAVHPGEQGKGFRYPYKGRLFNFKSDDVLIHATCNNPEDNALQGSTYVIYIVTKTHAERGMVLPGLEERG